MIPTIFIPITFTVCDILDRYLPRSLSNSETGLVDTNLDELMDIHWLFGSFLRKMEWRNSNH